MSKCRKSYQQILHLVCQLQPNFVCNQYINLSINKCIHIIRWCYIKCQDYLARRIIKQWTYWTCIHWQLTRGCPPACEFSVGLMTLHSKMFSVNENLTKVSEWTGSSEWFVLGMLSSLYRIGAWAINFDWPCIMALHLVQLAVCHSSISLIHQTQSKSLAGSPGRV
jgi:hypothetical protein